MPPPTPVPSVYRTRLLAPRPAPATYSPQAAQLASFSMNAAVPPSARLRSSGYGTFFQPGRLLALSRVRRSRSSGPGTPEQTAVAGPVLAVSGAQAAAIRRTVSSGPREASVGMDVDPRRPPEASQTPILT